VGTLEPRTLALRAGGVALYLCAVALFVLFQEVGLVLRRDESRAWWASTGRDLLNLAGVAGIAASLWGFGLPAPAAIVIGGTLTLVLFGTSIWLETRPWRARRRWALLAGGVLALPLVVFPEPLLEAFGALSGRLFGIR
jgi:hypothetical protein